MAEILNQNEIDALLSDIESGDAFEAKEKEEKKQKQVSIYDFRHPNLITKEHFRILQMVHERFCQILENYLTSKLRTLANVKLIAVDQVTYSEFSLSMSDPSCIYVLRIEELQGDAIMELTLPFVFYSIDRLLGGTGKTFDEMRELTLIEQRIIGSIGIDMVKELNNAWVQVMPLNCYVTSYQSRPNFIQIAPIEEIVISISIEVKAQDATGFINLCFPIQIFESILPNLSAQQIIRSNTVEYTPEDEKAVIDRVREAPLDIQAELGRKKITVRELLDMEVGDVLTLDTRVNSPVPVYINGRPQYWGQPGIKDKHISLKIAGLVNETDAEATTGAAA